MIPAKNRRAAFLSRWESISAESSFSFPEDTSMPYSGLNSNPVDYNRLSYRPYWEGRQRCTESRKVTCILYGRISLVLMAGKANPWHACYSVARWSCNSGTRSAVWHGGVVTVARVLQCGTVEL
ncbi:hypothetical protein TNCV_2592151 [Trichonephila clavipes]|nr:hypothetical protein TNCV_2592151 [Trichonephila clavipes]